MKISRDWLQVFFEPVLPASEQLERALTFHSFEIEGVENDILDVKVTPNRGHDCLSVRGIAKEISAILDIPLKADPLRSHPDLSPKTDAIEITIDEPNLCRRYIAGYIRGVLVKESPEWLKKALESMGQRSINNVVDATNYVMFHLGQPLHAFDAGQIIERDGVYEIRVRKAREGERMVALDAKEYTLAENMLVIADARADAPIGIAGVKGGAPAGITEETSDIIIESANFDGVSVRKTAQALKLRTDASSRFEQGLSPELPAFGMRAAADLILDLAGGELVGFADEYPTVQAKQVASVSVAHVNRVLGTSYTAEDISRVFTRLDLAHQQTGDEFKVYVPFERLDLSEPEDLVEEIGRILGYDRVPTVALQYLGQKPEISPEYYAAERLRADLTAKGFSEVFTSVFAEHGDRAVANKVGGDRPFLRKNLEFGLMGAVERNKRIKELLGLKDVRLFEIGTVWEGGRELLRAYALDEKGNGSYIELTPIVADTYEDFPISKTERYQPFSKYPFIVRDIALWVPEHTSSDQVLSVIREASGDLLVRSNLFDEFKKEGRVSYAFRLVFQSFDKTLTDGEVNERMESVNSAVQKQGWEVR